MTRNRDFRYSAQVEQALADLAAATGPAVGEAALRVIVWCGHGWRLGEAAPDPARLIARGQLDAAAAELQDTVGGWAVAVRELGERWYACESPVDADDLLCHWLDRRTDVWAAEAGFAVAGVEVDVTAFDRSMAEHRGIIATLVGSPWYELLVKPYREAAGGAGLPWWLGEDLTREAAALEVRANSTLPPNEYFAVVRGVRQWKANDPEVIRVLGAFKKGPLPGMRTFTWASPDGTLTARLDVLAKTTADHRRTAAYPLVFERGADTPAVELAGTPIRLGTVRRVVDKTAQVLATIAEWWTDSDGRLFVGDPPTEWLRKLPPTE